MPDPSRRVAGAVDPQRPGINSIRATGRALASRCAAYDCNSGRLQRSVDFLDSDEEFDDTSSSVSAPAASWVELILDGGMPVRREVAYGPRRGV